MEPSSRHDRLRRLAETALQPGFVGTTVPDWVRGRIADGGLTSVVLFGRNIVDPEQVARLTAELRAENRDLIIAIDEEAGDVTRLEAWTGASRPGNLALGAVDDVDLTESVARDIGRELHAAGISSTTRPAPTSTPTRSTRSSAPAPSAPVRTSSPGTPPPGYAGSSRQASPPAPSTSPATGTPRSTRTTDCRRSRGAPRRSPRPRCRRSSPRWRRAYVW